MIKMEPATLEQAREFTINAHGYQKYVDQPYIFHLDGVVAILKEFGFFDPAALNAAMLHDVIEDTHVTTAELESLFGTTSALAVYILTDIKNGNRRERKSRSNQRLALLSSVVPHELIALIVKPADRLFHFRNAEKGSKIAKMYLKEHGEFEASAYRVNVNSALFNAIYIEIKRLTS